MGAKGFVQWARQWIRGLDGWLMIAALAIVVVGWGFIEIAELVLEGETHRIDDALLMALRVDGDPSDPLGALWVEELGRDMTALGGYGVLTMMVLAVIGYLYLVSQYGAILFVLVASLGGLVVTHVLKDLFGRPRPDLVSHLSHVSSPSFPSGHSMMAATIYLTLGSLLARLVVGKKLKLYFIGLAMVIAFLVGLSRVYLGVHYPSDVLAGWAGGLIWGLICWSAARYFRLQGRLSGQDQD